VKGKFVGIYYGIKVIFGKIGNFFFASLILFSCANGHECDQEKAIYSEYWDYEVETTYRDKTYNATYVIKTTSGKEIRFQPVQYIVSLAQPGDRIYKKKNSEYAFLIDRNGDSIRSRIFSVSCDSMVIYGKTSYR
jgi:hypothetical protein